MIVKRPSPSVPDADTKPSLAHGRNDPMNKPAPPHNVTMAGAIGAAGAPPPHRGVRSPIDAGLSGDDRTIRPRGARRGDEREHRRVGDERALVLALVLRSRCRGTAGEPLDRADRAALARIAVAL